MAVELEEAVYDKLIGQTLANRYHIETRLGEGAMGAVYRAKHVKVGRAFAVKILHPRLLLDNKVLARFEREAELAGRLRHPNVIGVVDVGETPEGVRYMVMDFAEGPDLATLLSEAPMKPERVASLTRQMLEGLFHAHEQGLIHRDFKPENVIIEKDSHGAEVPRIVDFGIAILREGGESSNGPGRLTTNGLVLGTPHYMAPEQAVADPIDHRIDLFALGIMVYEMLCGKLPFDGSGAEVARANLLLDPPLISERVPYLEVDPLLEAFARRMMAKKREQRPATAKVARDLLDLIDKDRSAAAAALGVPLDAARTSMTTQDAQPVRAHTGEGTFPPPIREALGTPVQAPAISANNAVRSREAVISTQQTAALEKKRRGPIIGAAIVGIGIVAGAAVVLMTGGKDKHKADAADTVAITTPTTDKVAEPAPPPAPVPEPTPSPIAETGSSGAEAMAGSAQTPTNVVVPDAAQNVAGKPKTQGKTPKTTTSVKTTTGAAGAQTAVAETKDEPKDEPKALDASTLASQYKTVGAQLKALEEAKGRDATTDLWARYRFIRLSDAMGTQEKRDAAAEILSKLTSDIATRKK
jgi:serine/threonine-protein kinase